VPHPPEHLICMAGQVHEQLLAAHIPHLERAVLAATHKQAAVSRPGNLLGGGRVEQARARWAAQGGLVTVLAGA
jgi:hypothetical protein